MKKKCPRCSKTFNCRSDNLFECGCMHVILSADDYRYISKHFDDCLCPVCLTQIKTERQCSPKLPAAPPLK
ncbi:cysteine-rich CWC family protein [Geofilum rhodophaeum]|uniref:cysteine-rich CWC family protein n=1 Tax=Geofilum rhodophaeum TaxID=1965019 RepID=UPI000B5271D2